MGLFRSVLYLGMTAACALAAPDGKTIYATHCASCHGDQGQGDPDECPDPLHGDRSLDSLTRYIDRRMPEDEPHLVVGEEARAVAEYIYHAFYSPATRQRKGAAPAPRPAFARLTARQFRESVTDLFASFSPPAPPVDPTGLTARYYQSDGMNKKARQVVERRDSRLEFDFGPNPPVEGISADQFSIAWDGSLVAPLTGWYEFRLSTPNGARLYLNGERQEGDGNHRDDSGAKRQPALIDDWVSSGADVRTSTARIFLLGGRNYPIRLDYFKYKEARGLVKLEWKAPGSPWEVVATPWLSPTPAPHLMICSQDFPADDASEGFERGTEISKAWQDAVTSAALQLSQQASDRLTILTGVGLQDPNLPQRTRDFVTQLAERAFRRPLDDSLRKLYVDRPLADVPPDLGVKRAVLLILLSPRFLYPEIQNTHDDWTTASRLALGLWDSLPDQPLREAAGRGELRSPEQVEAQARRMLQDPRAKAKLMVFFRRWLKIDPDADLRKDPGLFPGFNEALVADLRQSLENSIGEIVWSESSDYRRFLDTDRLFLNERLARYYGFDPPAQSGFQPVSVDRQRFHGLLTHPYVLARLAHPDGTSPIHRGVFLARNLLGTPLKPPPQAIAFENSRFDPHMTMREKVAELTRDSSCMTCHETINPLGFALEHFDATGRFRTTEQDRPINPESDFPTLSGDTIRLRGPGDIARHAAESPDARRAFIRQLFQTTAHENPAAFGPETLDHLENRFVSQHCHILQLVIEIQKITALHRTPAI